MNVEDEIKLSRVPFFVLVMVLFLLTALWSYQEHNYARRDREAAMDQRDRVAVIEDRIRDSFLHCSVRPLVIYYVGEDDQGDEILINWPNSVVRLLGWTRKDIEKDGLEILIPNTEEKNHTQEMLKMLRIPDAKQKVLMFHRNVLHKNGSLVPLKITVWALGKDTRTLVAHIVEN